jgi:UDP-2,3-diacylglucosamine pyrophosphatase LpxH
MRGRRFSLVLSDLHLGAGDPGPDGSPNPLEDFREDAAFVELMRHYDQLYSGQPGEWVANGDFFELLFFSREQRQGARLGESEALERVQAVVEGHPAVFDAVAAFAGTQRRRVVFVTGNHDPALYFRSVRRYLKQRIDGDVRFHWHHHRADDTLIEHGHRFEESYRIQLDRDLVRGDSCGGIRSGRCSTSPVSSASCCETDFPAIHACAASLPGRWRS